MKKGLISPETLEYFKATRPPEDTTEVRYEEVQREFEQHTTLEQHLSGHHHEFVNQPGAAALMFGSAAPVPVGEDEGNLEAELSQDADQDNDFEGGDPTL